MPLQQNDDKIESVCYVVFCVLCNATFSCYLEIYIYMYIHIRANYVGAICIVG